MRPALRVVAFAVVAVGSPLVRQAEAQFVVDQSQLVVARFNSSSSRVGQTFEPTIGNVAGAGAFVSNPTLAAFTAALSAELWAGGIGNTPGATLIASGTQIYTLAAGASGWVDVFWTAVGVTPGTTYFLDYGSNNASSRFGFACCSSPTPSAAYLYGDLYRGNSPSTGTTYRAVQEADLTFREYYVTPEPGTSALFATGLIGFFGVARRRRA